MSNSPPITSYLGGELTAGELIRAFLFFNNLTNRENHYVKKTHHIRTCSKPFYKCIFNKYHTILNPKSQSR